MTIKSTMNNVHILASKTLEAGLVPLLHGSPGIGKSAVAKAIAEEFNLKLIDMRLAECEPTDMMGFPFVDKETGKAGYAPMNTFPIEGDPIPKGYSGWLLLLDEITSADRSVQKAAYKLTYDKQVGNHRLHPNVAVMAAGNLDTDNAIVEEMSTALQSRMVHFECELNSTEWLDWASANGIDYRINAYVNFKPDNLYSFKPDHPDKTYACPRTWEFASKLLQLVDVSGKEAMPLLAGTLSEGVAREFLQFLRIYKDLPSIQDIETSPAVLAVPTEPSILYALTSLISHHATDSNLGNLMTYMSRLGKEFQVVCLRDLVRRQRDMIDHPAVDKWLQVNGSELF